MAAAGQTHIVRKKRRRRRRIPLFPFVLVGLLGIGIFWGARLLMRRRPEPISAASPPAGYIVEVSALRVEYSHYYGKPIEESIIEGRFRQAADLMGARNYPGASAVLETLSRKAALPVVFSNLGIVYSALGDWTRSADAFRDALARDSEYAPARQFLRNAKSIAPNSADPYTREVEPNNEPRTATLIGLGVPASGEVTASTNDVDYFRVVTPAPPRDLLSVELANHSIEFAPRLHIYSENLRLLSWGEKTAHSGDSIRVVGGPAPNSALYISIAASDGQSGQYVLSVKPQKAFDRYEPNDDIMSSRRITMGEEINANIMDAEDTDFYSFQSPRKGTVTIEIHNLSESLIPGVTTYNTDHRNMGFGPEIRKPGQGLHHTIDVDKDRVYYIQVWSQAGSSGAYTLRVD
jgi:hypothetical protein